MTSFLRSSLFSFAILISFSGMAQTPELPKPYLADSPELVYDMSLTYKDYYGSGLYVMKRLAPGEYHAVFLSKVGLKLMEFKIINGDFKWIKLLEVLDKKSFRNMLERDFALLMLVDLDQPEKSRIVKTKSDQTCFKIWNQNKVKVCANMLQVNYATNIRLINLNKTKIRFEDYDNSVPNSVVLTHRLVKVKIQLDKMKR